MLKTPVCQMEKTRKLKLNCQLRRGNAIAGSDSFAAAILPSKTFMIIVGDMQAFFLFVLLSVVKDAPPLISKAWAS